MCNKDVYTVMLHGPPRNGCQENLFEVMKEWGVEDITDIPNPFNLFMTTIADTTGKIEITGPHDKPGDHVELRAEMDLIVAISTCPNDIDPRINRGKCKPMKVQIYA